MSDKNITNYPRVSIVNCVSQALEMLRFSSEELIKNAGTDNFDYIIVCWNTTKEVDEYISSLQEKFRFSHPRLKIHRVNHKEIPDIGYVPNLRGMINEGFEEGFKLNEYAGLVNTDQAFYQNWLINLIKHCDLTRTVSSVVVMPRAILGHYQANFGHTEYGLFDMEGFNNFCEEIIRPNELKTEFILKERRDLSYLNLVGFPYLFPRAMWQKAGPWELTLDRGTPDVNFFKRTHKYGFEYVVSLDSIVYHEEGGERGKAGKPAPSFSKNMKYDPIPFLARLRIKLKKGFYRLLKKLRIIKKEPIL